jgi:hypothetical protein
MIYFSLLYPMLDSMSCIIFLSILFDMGCRSPGGHGTNGLLNSWKIKKQQKNTITLSSPRLPFPYPFRALLPPERRLVVQNRCFPSRSGQNPPRYATKSAPQVGLPTDISGLPILWTGKPSDTDSRCVIR